MWFSFDSVWCGLYKSTKYITDWILGFIFEVGVSSSSPKYCNWVSKILNLRANENFANIFKISRNSMFCPKFLDILKKIVTFLFPAKFRIWVFTKKIESFIYRVKNYTDYNTTNMVKLSGIKKLEIVEIWVFRIYSNTFWSIRVA